MAFVLKLGIYYVLQKKKDTFKFVLWARHPKFHIFDIYHLKRN